MDRVMPKTLKLKLEDRLEYINFYEAFQRTKKNKPRRKEIYKFELDLETNLYTLIQKIKTGKYHFGKYREFLVYEPKIRTIRALPFQDRIIHQWYVEEFIKPYFLPRFIKDSYACIEGKGTHKAVEQIERYMRSMKRKYKEYYILKCDIKKFFNSIDLEILENLMKRYIHDQQLQMFTNKIIYENSYETVGIPIGNYTSQFFANIYLNKLDQYIKQECHIKYYIRYMDDFILLLPTKNEAKAMYQKIEYFLKKELNLSLNEKSRFFPNALGVDFCGYHIYETHRLLRKRSITKMKKQIKYWNWLYHQENLDYNKAQMSWNCWIAHSTHASCHTLQQKLYDQMDFREKINQYLPTQQIEKNN